jgi:hypothetical protein
MDTKIPRCVCKDWKLEAINISQEVQKCFDFCPYCGSALHLVDPTELVLPHWCTRREVIRYA